MKYMLLIHSNPAAWEALPKDEADRVLADHFEMMDTLAKSGELIRVEGLANERRFVEIRNGSPVVTDGPFGEVKEQLAGIFTVDIENVDRAMEIAAPLAQHGIVEIRPVMEEAGMEM